MVSRSPYHADHYYGDDNDEYRGDNGHDQIEVRQNDLDGLFRGKGPADVARRCDST